MLGPQSNIYFAAINAPQWQNSENCGKCIELSNGSKKIQVQIVDSCPECAYGDIDLSEQAFVKLAKKSQGRVKNITWKFLDKCPDSILEGSKKPKLSFKDGSTEYWVGL